VARGRDVEVPFFSKAPFANYDLIVYLGGGLFSLLIFWRYIAHPFGIFDFSDIVSTGGGQSWVVDVIYLVLLGVCSYVLGHLISYQSSYFIEGFVERTLGRFSRIIEITTVRTEDRAKSVKRSIAHNLRRYLIARRVKIPFTKFKIIVPKPYILTFLHLPFWLWYSIIVRLDLFDFADTRLPSRMISHLKDVMRERFAESGYEDGKQWFRWVEYYTSYNKPVAASSMYNYLVISGLMRSLSYLFLIAVWLEVAHLVLRVFYFDAGVLSHGPGGILGWSLYLLVLFVGYITSLTSYCKFFRRYVEEAVMGFLLENSGSEAADIGVCKA